MIDCFSSVLQDLQEKRLAVISSDIIAEEVMACAKKYDLKVIDFRSSKDLFKKLLYFAVNRYFTRATPLLLKAFRIDAVLLISGEGLIWKNIGWLSESKYPFYSTREQWNTLMNKRSFEAYAAKFGLPPIPSYQVDPSAPIASGAVEYPLIVKPSDRSGSSGVSICMNETEVEKAIASALGISRLHQVICQKYLSGPYFQFEVWMQNGKAYFPYVKDRVYYPPVGNCPPQSFIDFYPSVNHDLVSSSVFKRIEQVMTSLKIENGSCMFQGIIENGIPYIMDTAFRISGGLDFKVVQKETGVDLIEAHILYSLGKQFGNDFSHLNGEFKHAYAVLCIGLKNGIIANIEGLDEIREKPYVFDCFQHYRIGQRMTTSGQFSQTCLRFFLTDASREALKADIKEVLSILRIEDRDKNSLILDYPEF